MKEIDLEFDGGGSVQGFHFKQLKKSDAGYLYEVTSKFGSTHYEVFVRREQEAGTVIMGGKEIEHEAKVLYPRDNAFGMWAWCVKDYGRALDRFQKLKMKEVNL